MDPVVNISTISELHALTGLSEPAHPLIGMYVLRNLPQVSMDHAMGMAMNLSLYTVMYKEGLEGSIGYGRSQYDYENGTLIFTAPGQELRFEGKRHAKDSASWMLLFHPDLLAGTDLGRRMDEYTYFEYDVTEALHLSTAEQTQALDIGMRIEAEYSQKLDACQLSRGNPSRHELQRHVLLHPGPNVASRRARLFRRQHSTRGRNHHACGEGEKGRQNARQRPVHFGRLILPSPFNRIGNPDTLRTCQRAPHHRNHPR